jgi:hypothetical protein
MIYPPRTFETAWWVIQLKQTYMDANGSLQNNGIFVD